MAGVFKTGTADANSILTNENRRCSKDVTNLPTDENYGLLYTRGMPGWFMFQIFVSTSGVPYRRAWVNSWGEWVQV